MSISQDTMRADATRLSPRDYRSSTATNFPFHPWEGRLFGGLVLAAFLLYGIGSAMAEEPIGLILVVANSIAVATIGVIGFRLLRNHHPRAGAVYLTGRIAEATFLAGGIVLHTVGDVTDADNTGYLLGMIALGLGSLPFWHVVGQGPWLSKRFALLGIVGYTALAIGAALELATGWNTAIFAAVPGGLFEIAIGVHLLRRGFGTAAE